MAYIGVKTWDVANARRAGGLGDISATTPAPAPAVLDPFSPNAQVAQEIAYGLPLTGNSAGSSVESGIVGVLDSVSNLFTPATVPTPASLIPPPPPATTASSLSFGEWIGIGVGAVVLLLILSRRR